jgi:endonuclease/exonuclease/phosphatase family metal-dependent hydrolase
VRRHLRVASYNLLHGISLRSGHVDLPAAAAAIGALDADVVALQEVDRALPRSGEADQVGELAAALGMDARFAPALLGSPDASWDEVGDTDPGSAAYGVGLLSRLPIRTVARVPLPGGGAATRAPGASPSNPGWDREPRVALVADLALDDTAVLRVTSTHLSYLPWRGVAQLACAARAAADGDAPAALVGDLNLPASAVRVLLAAAGWQHAGGGATYPAWEPRVQVDQILVRGGLEVVDVAVGEAGPSDHLPLVATVAV